MPFIYSETCPACGEEHGIKIDWATLGIHDCPKCGKWEAIEISWDTEYGVEPITEDDR